LELGDVAIPWSVEVTSIVLIHSLPRLGHHFSEASPRHLFAGWLAFIGAPAFSQTGVLSERPGC
jgi:hypothetical protein